MRAVLLNTGTELLAGDVHDTHLAFIAREIFALGLRIEDVDLAFDCPRSTTIRAAILQDCVYGRVADRRSDRQKSSFNSRSRARLLRATGRSRRADHRQPRRA